jgi:predicted nucleotidyltransferase
MSTLVLIMRTRQNIADLLFGQTRRSVLTLLYGHADETFYLRQIARLAERSVSAVQREVLQLSDAGLITRSVRGNQVLYQVNAKSPVFGELKSLIVKTAGAPNVIREGLLPVRDRILLAFIYGSVARQHENANSDVDLMVIGSAGFGEIVSGLQGAQKMLGREVNPTVYTKAEFQEKLRRGNHFLTRVLEGEKLFVIGDERELAAMARKRMAQSAPKQPRGDSKSFQHLRSRS